MSTASTVDDNNEYLLLTPEEYEDGANAATVDIDEAHQNTAARARRIVSFYSVFSIQKWALELMVLSGGGNKVYGM